MQLTRGAVARALAVVAPWTWFFVRDRSVVFELVAVLLPLIVAIAFAVLVGLAVRRRWVVAPAASVLALGVVAVVGPWLPRATGQPDAGVTIAVANVLADNRRAADVVEDILAIDADIVVVPEAPQAVHDRLAAVYDHALRVDREDGVLGVYAGLPVVDPDFIPGLLPRTRQLRIEVDGPGGRFVLWALHLPKPWFDTADASQLRPGGHARKLDAFLAAFDDETLPVVVAGDTNLTDRGRGYRTLTARFDDALRGTWGGPTARKWYLRPLLLRVDHVFMPEGWCADRAGRFALAGSDHRGVHARVGPCRD